MQGITRTHALLLTLILSFLNIILFTTTVQANVNSARLSGTMELAPSDVDLSFEGSNDWVHYGPSLNSTDRKAQVTPQISDVKILGKIKRPKSIALYSPYNNYFWTDGTRKANHATKSAIRLIDIGNGFEIKVPADTTQKTLKVFLGIKKASGKVEASLSDGSTSPIIMRLDQATAKSKHILTFNFQAASRGQVLTVRYSLTNKFDNNIKSYISLEAATLRNEIDYFPENNIADLDKSSENSRPKISTANQSQPERQNKNTQAIEINPMRDLGLEKGKQVCFSLKSYNNIAESSFSKAVCGRIRSNHSLTLVWEKAKGKISGYQIYFGKNRKTANENFLTDMIENG